MKFEPKLKKLKYLDLINKKFAVYDESVNTIKVVTSGNLYRLRT
jgi:hypothetical protein